jgi:hypothetical protein
MSDAIIGIGPEGLFTVKCLGRTFDIRYVVNIRSDATPEMVVESIKHFKHAAQCLSIGAKQVSKQVAEINKGHRSEYEDAYHDQSRTSVWTFRSFLVVPHEGKIYKVPLNIFNEYTDAQTLIDWAWAAVELMTSKDLTEDFAAAGSIIFPEVEAAQGQLDEYFPRDEKGNMPKPQTATTPVPAPTQPQSGMKELPEPTHEQHESPYLGSYDYKQKGEYAQAYNGKTIRFDVMKMERIFDTRDGTPLVQTYSSYDGGVSKYPSHDLKVKPNRLEKVDPQTRYILESTLNPSEGTDPTNNRKYIGTYYVYVPEEGKVYMLLTKLDAV